jgi:hypothetical protein
MAGPDSAPRVTVEVFVEQHEVAPVRVVRVRRLVAVARSATVVVRKEEARQPCRKLRRDAA